MKKTLIALAALAAGSAFAQSSVTLYGRLDAGIAHTASNAASPVGATGVVSSFNSPSMFGLKGSEDLGGGLKANFNLESGTINMGTGAADAGFTRRAWVGLSGNFGDVQFGRNTTISNAIFPAIDLNSASYASAAALAGVQAANWYNLPRRSSEILYRSPVFSGVQVLAAYQFAADNLALNTAIPTSTSGAENKGVFQLGATYNNGPLFLGFAAEQAHANTTAAANRTAYALGGTYDFGVAKVSAGYDRNELAAGATGAPTLAYVNSSLASVSTITSNTSVPVSVGQGYFLGVSVPFGATTVGAQYANNTDFGLKAFELFANYNLSKRTFLYVDAAHQNVSNSAVNATNGGLTRYAVGVQHNF